MTDEISGGGSSSGAEDFYAEYYGNETGYDPVMAEIDAMVGIGDLDEKVLEESRVTGRPIAECALKRGLNMADSKWWGQPEDLNGDSEQSKINFTADQNNKAKIYDNPLARMAHAISDCVQFPFNTTFLHGCGILSAAMIRKFCYVSFKSKKHIGLYTVAAQPPSSGKSPTNDYFSVPIISKIDEMNSNNEPMRMLIGLDVERLERELGKAHKMPPGQARDLAEQLIAKRRELESVAAYGFGHTDATPEALEEVASRQYGRFSIISDEAEGVSVLTGANYGTSGQANLGVVLKGWDGGHQNSARIGRPGYKGRLYGAVAVLAQESTVAAILKTGRNENGSRGVCERFWILDEPNWLGEKDPDKYIPLDIRVNEEYTAMVQAVVMQNDPVEFELSNESIEFIKSIKRGLIPYIRDGGKYSDELMRSVLGKCDSQICKMASVLHCAKEWAPSGKRSKVIQVYEVAHAANMYMQMVRCFVSAAEEQNLGGEMTDMRVAAYKLKQIVTNKEEPKLSLPFGEFCDKLKRTKPFLGRKNHRKSCREKLIPKLIESNYIVFCKTTETVFINPRVRKI